MRCSLWGGEQREELEAVLSYGCEQLVDDGVPLVPVRYSRRVVRNIQRPAQHHCRAGSNQECDVPTPHW